MKVVHIVEALAGGVYTYFKNLSAYSGNIAATDGIETYIIYTSHRKEIDPAKVIQDFSDKVTLIEIPMVTELSPFQDIKSSYRLYKALKKIKPDIIHLHSSKAGVIGRIAALFVRKKKQVFYTPHGYSFLRTDISKNKRLFYRFIEKYTQFFLGGITIACGDTEYEIAQSLGNSLLVRNGIEINEITKYYKPVINNRLKVGIVGRITFPRAPELFNTIALKFPELDFIWIGDGELRHLVTAPNITITGWKFNHKEVLEYLTELDIYLQTSLWEGLPIAVLEAMALQKPVIATNVIGNKDIVTTGETGFLFTDTEELYNFFAQLKDDTTRIAFGKKGFERCKLLFDKDKNFAQLISIYKSYA